MKLFVYGTLKQGGRLHQYLIKQTFIKEDKVRGEMYNTWMGYPVLFDGEDLIQGEVYDCHHDILGRIIAVKTDTGYRFKKRVTESGEEVMLFIFKDESFKVREHKITNFKV